MVIASLVDIETNEVRGRAYLSEVPFPGDTVSTRDHGDLLVVRRSFIDLGPDSGSASERLSAVLTVRNA